MTAFLPHTCTSFHAHLPSFLDLLRLLQALIVTLRLVLGDRLLPSVVLFQRAGFEQQRHDLQAVRERGPDLIVTVLGRVERPADDDQHD